MQRIYGKQQQGYYELKEPTPSHHTQHQPHPPSPPPITTNKHNEMARPSFTIPSSSHLAPRPINPSNYPHPSETSPPPMIKYPTGADLYPSPRSLHCIVIADHIGDCPICSRFYRNYTPFYNTIIFILVIVLVVMMMRCQSTTSSLGTSSPTPPRYLHPSTSPFLKTVSSSVATPVV